MSPAGSSRLDARNEPSMMLTPGARLGPYEIVESIGSGGMGVVYRAHDGRLARDVAVKVVAAHLASEPEARARFEREAKAIAALSHPNILAIHDIGIEGEVPYTVTELLHGESLRTRLARGPLSWHDAITIALAASEGLATAHGRGIVHRDLKPENLFLTTEGRLKVLDFGLARTNAVGLPASREGESLTVAETHVGTIVGTVGYLSPEQARGEPATPASDVFALGCILFEMMAGRRAFDAPTAAERLAAVLNHHPAAACPGRRGPTRARRDRPALPAERGVAPLPDRARAGRLARDAAFGVGRVRRAAGPGGRRAARARSRCCPSSCRLPIPTPSS